MQHSFQKYTVQYPALIRLGVPITIGQLGTIVLGFADTLMIGHHSLPELAAASFVTNMFTLALLFGLGFSYGLTPIIGRFYGQSKPEAIGGALKNGLAAGSVLTLILLAVMTTLYLNLDRLGQPAELLRFMRPYFLINLVSIPFVIGFNTFKQFFDGTSNTVTSMVVMITGNVLNIAGNYIFIYGHLGCPEMGLFGAGLSTMLSRVFIDGAVFCASAQPTLSARLFQPKRQPPRFSLSKQARLAFGLADGHGDSRLQPVERHGGMDWHHSFGRPSSDAHH